MDEKKWLVDTCGMMLAGKNGDKSVQVPLLHNTTRVYWTWNEPGLPNKKYRLIV
jgi:hypothetical protein